MPSGCPPVSPCPRATSWNTFQGMLHGARRGFHGVFGGAAGVRATWCNTFPEVLHAAGGGIRGLPSVSPCNIVEHFSASVARRRWGYPRAAPSVPVPRRGPLFGKYLTAPAGRRGQ